MTEYHTLPDKTNSKHYLKYNNNYACTYTSVKGRKINKDEQNKLIIAKEERKKNKLPHSASKLRTLKKNLFDIDIERTSGTTYFFTLKPVSEIEPQEFSYAVKRLITKLRSDNAEYIYTLEWALYEQAPHIHLVANIPGETTAACETYANNVIRLWIKNIPNKSQPRIRQDFRDVYDGVGLFGYISKSIVNTFNDKAIQTGKDWSVISVTGCSRNWKRFKTKTLEIEFNTKAEVTRKMKNLMRSRGVELNTSKLKGYSEEVKKAISAVTSFTVSRLPVKDIERLLLNIDQSNLLKEEKLIMECRDLYHQAHIFGLDHTKEAINRILLDKGYDMSNMFQKWEKPRMLRNKRYETYPFFRMICKARNECRKVMLVVRRNDGESIY